MATFGSRFKCQINESYMSLNRLLTKDYETEDIKEIINPLVINFELFLKSVIFPSENPGKNLESFIDKLLGEGLSQNKVDLLHNLRREYNGSKHAPAYQASLLEILELFKSILPIIDDIVNLGIGITNNYVSPLYKRVFWIAAWDHFVGGDTEIHIVLPGESEHWLGPPSIDIIYTDIRSWDSVKSELGLIGTLKGGENLIPSKLYQAYSLEGDFLDALVFEGHYKDLVSILSKYEVCNDLLPGLNRKDDMRSMLQAFLLSSIDIFSNVTYSDKEKIISDIQSQAISVYGVPEGYSKSNFISKSITDMLSSIEQSSWIRISGLRWLNKEDFIYAKKEALAVSDKFNLLVDEKFTICMLE